MTATMANRTTKNLRPKRMILFLAVLVYQKVAGSNHVGVTDLGVLHRALDDG